MHRYRITKEAVEDLRAIGIFTRRTWSAAQQRTYLARLDRRMEWLVDHPELSQRRDEVRSGYRSFREARHIIFFREAEGTIEIVRVLHDRMDRKRRL